MDARQVIIAPVQSEKSYSGLEHSRYTFKVHPDADKVQIRRAIEVCFPDVKVASVATSTVKDKPKRRGIHKGTKPGYKKAVVELSKGSIQIFEGVH